MNKNIIQLSESELKKIITESVKKILKENNINTFNYDCTDYRDVYTTCGIKGGNEFDQVYKKLQKFIQYEKTKSDWDILDDEDVKYLFKALRYAPSTMIVQTRKKGNATPEIMEFLYELDNNIKNLKEPNLWVGVNGGFGENAKQLRKYIKNAYYIYDDFINKLVNLHYNDDMKRQDIKADWSKYDKEVNKRKNNDTNLQMSNRNLKNFGFSQDIAQPLTRYDIVANPDDEQNQKYHDILTGNFNI